MHKRNCSGAFLALWFSTALMAQSYALHPDLVYGTYRDANNQQQNLLLDLYVPIAGPTPRPLIVWIHGGAWRGGSRHEVPPIATAMCAGGYAVASIEYRFSQTAIWPAQLHDCKGAIRWLRAQAATYQLDSNRFGVWGVSAGAQLAMMVAVTGEGGAARVGNQLVDLEGNVGGNLLHSSRVQAVCDWFGPTTFVRARELPTPTLPNRDAASSPESLLVGGPVQERLEQCMSADPITFLSQDDPPMLIMHGTLDTVAAFNQSELLVDAARRNHGLTANLVPVAGADHGDGPFYQPAVTIEVYTFFNDHLLARPQRAWLSLVDGSAGEAGLDPARVLVQRAGSLAQPLRVHLATSGSAAPGADYQALPHWVTIPAGMASIGIDILPLDDLLVEGTQDLDIRLGSGLGYHVDVTRQAVTIDLLDDEPAPAEQVSILALDPRATEAGNDPGSFLLSRTGPITSPLDVRIAWRGTAHGGDYQVLGNVQTIPANQASLTIPIRPIQDSAVEPGEWVLATLLESSAYGITDVQALVRIHDDDALAALPIVSVTATDPEAWEGTLDFAEFTILRTGSLFSGLTVQLTAGGVARSGIDCPALPTSVFFPPGSYAQTVPVQAVWDLLAEGDEELTLSVVPAAAYRPGSQRQGIVLLRDVDSFLPPNPNRLSVGALSLGEMTTVQIEANPSLGASTAYSLYVAAQPTYLPTPFGVLAIDLATGFELASGLGSNSATTSFRMPVRPELLGGTMYLQSFTAGLNPLRIELTNAVARRVGSP